MTRDKATRCLLPLAAGLIGLALLPGCTERRQLIDQVQPHALRKAHFVGEDLRGAADDPEFYALATLVDVGGYGASQDGLFTSTYAQRLVRIKWHITEDLLLGRLAYERIEGSDGRGVGSAVNDGTVVMAFRIESHFDIMRAYDPGTREQLGFIEENTVDRPWYEREYMRVDWSRNLSTDSYDFDTLSLLGVQGGITYEPIAYDVTDPDDRDAPVFDLENGYFDITNKAFARPQMIDVSSLGWGVKELPACFLPNDLMRGSYPAGSCDPVELTMRFSFRRVDEHLNDYEPMSWDRYRFQAAGAFTSERFGFARGYGMTDQLWHHLINRANIWKRSHFYESPDDMTGPVECFTPATTPFGEDPNRDLDHSGTEDECELVGRGSRCDTYKQRCTLPYRDREPRTQAWYVTEGSDLGYFEASKRAAHEWDVALRLAARTAQYAECVGLGGEACDEDYPVFFGQMTDHQDMVQLAWEVDACREGLAHVGRSCDEVAEDLAAARGLGSAHTSIALLPEMIVLCHSPVQADDPEACEGPRLPPELTAQGCQDAEAASDRETMALCRQAKRVRLGEIRHHVVNLIKEPQTPSPWGIWTGGTDPLTGEVVANCVNVWTSVSDQESQLLVDILRYLFGELSTMDITDGELIREWSEAARASARSGVAPRLTRQQLESRVAQFTGLPVGQTVSLSPDLAGRARALKQELKGVKASLTAASVSKPTYSARREAVASTWFEAQLMTPMMQQLHRLEGLPINDSIMDLLSPLRGGNPSWERDLFNLRQATLGQRSACIMHHDSAAPSPFSLASLGKQLQEKFGSFDRDDPPDVQHRRAERMRDFLARRIHSNILAHEMGHAMGLRHNLVSSSFAYAYRPQYWQLRTRNGTVTTECSDLSATGEDCVGPRWFDPVTENEQDNLIWMWMQSSVMDYPGETTQHLLGLGIYDFAAARLFYGDVASVLDDESIRAGTGYGRMMASLTDNFGGILGYSYEAGSQEVHYSQLDRLIHLIDDCETLSDPEVHKPVTWDEERDGAWSPLLDGHIVKVNGQHTRCQDQKVDYVAWDRLRYPTASEVSGIYYSGGPSVDPSGRLRVPYGFAADGFADLGNASVYRHDNGADPYEIFNFLMTQQEVNHVFDSYRRGRTTFSLRETASRSLNRYNTKMRDGAKGLGLMKSIYEGFGLEIGYNSDQFWPMIAKFLFSDNILAASMVFDHFSRTMARPQPGIHSYWEADLEPVLRATGGSYSGPGSGAVNIPEGVTYSGGGISLGGRPIENRIAEVEDDYSRTIPLSCGQYYDKLSTAMLMTESVDNFISSTRQDFVDARYRAVSLADLFPEGYRRWIANNLTGDELLKGARVAADAQGNPTTGPDGYPDAPIGYITWWTEPPEVCFPSHLDLLCSIPGGGSLDPLTPAHTAVLDPQVGWEQQKFLIAWTMMYLPENEETRWLDMLRIWELGRDADPALGQNRIELHDPMGRVFVAKTFGREEILGRTVQRGIAARVIEHANSLLLAAYEVTDGSDLDGDGAPDWYLPAPDPTTGQPIVKWDPGISAIDENGEAIPAGLPGCDAADNSQCTCAANRACVALSHYMSVPAYLREAIDAYRLGSPAPRGME